MASHLMKSAGRLGRLTPQHTALFLCDMQEKFKPNIKHFEQVVDTSRRMLQAATILDIPSVVTEQYPKGLGRTVPELGVEEHGLKPIAKTQFSMCVPEVEDMLKSNENIRSVMLCGIETHACILQTTMDLLEKGYDVHVVADACASRSHVDRVYALERMRHLGAFLTTSECAILSLAADSAHPKFRQLQKVIWTPAADSGLLPTPP
ncbi:isochorismatase domain-containing protein 2-like [Pollicipes pollicipes]|uniref:isochorismatase domain-containing protein 2-like n=1 Tax=Pollicipes pollicipes TaxID=41117 RepID=UPI00188588D5|nr:isochorismatase domain-containing protein 2-like [Pollicipes pollicipes]XP_037093094.1 isochorismatase domain-containing protein 2-like [Pollicipes pollicipes]